MNSSSGDSIEVRRTVNASRQSAFEAWTTPEHVRQWWAPTDTARCTRCEIDLRIGGLLRLDMHDTGDGSSCEVEGEFREIIPPERLVYTWDARTNQGDVQNTLVRVEFIAKSEEETEIVIRHSGLPDAPIRDGHREGWEKMLGSYAKYVRDEADPGEDFQMSLEFDVPADKLYQQFSSAEGVGNWWTKDCDFDAREGGKASFRFDDSGFYANMEVGQLEPPRLVEWKVVDAKHPESTGFSDLHDWNGTTIRFEITPLGNERSRLDFTHDGLGPLECYGVCSSLWRFYLNESLRLYFETGQGKPAA